MTKNTLLLTLLIVFVYSAFSQKNEVQTNTSKPFNNRIGLEIGYNQGYLKDDNFSALNYKESGLLYSLSYTNQNPDGKGVFNVDMDFSLGKLKTSVSEDFMSAITIANLEVSYVRKLKTKDNHISLYLGGQYNSYLQILDWKDFESFSFLATHGIGIKGLLAYHLDSKQKLTASLFIPVFQDLVRPPYNGINETIIENQDNTVKLIGTGKPSSFNTYVAFDLKFNYSYSISSRYDLATTYLLRYQNVSETNTVKHLENQLTVGLNYKF